MNKYMINMVHPKMIVQKGLKGCSTTRTVTTFAQKNRIPWVWWKPTANQKVMLVDWPQFRQAWKKCGPEFTGKASGPGTTGGRNCRGTSYGYGTNPMPKGMAKTGYGRARSGYRRSGSSKMNSRGLSYRRRYAA